MHTPAKTGLILSMFLATAWPWPAFGVEEPEPIMYVTRETLGVTSIPRWVSADAAFVGHSMVEELFSNNGRRHIMASFNYPPEPETGCYPGGGMFDVYGLLEWPETAQMIVRVRIVHAVPGFGWGSPGTLFRSELIEVLKAGPAGHENRKIFDFYTSRGQVPVGDKLICPRDSRFPDLRVGDEAVLLIHELYGAGETLVSIGEGGVLGIREGELIPEGEVFERIVGSPEVFLVNETLQKIRKAAAGEKE